jgi:hypothetical protein
VRAAVLVALALVAPGSPGAAAAAEVGPPSFLPGLWHFERTIAQGGRSTVLPGAIFATRREVTRCVNPSAAMQETFRPVNVGNCRSTPPERTEKGFVFALRCDFIGPVRTVIEVESESAYTETHESTLRPMKETIVARRLGDCPAEASTQVRRRLAGAAPR